MSSKLKNLKDMLEAKKSLIENGIFDEESFFWEYIAELPKPKIESDDYQESHKHRLAKELLTQWLRDCESPDRDEMYSSFGDIRWRPNWGIFEELPFYQDSELYYFETHKLLIDRRPENENEREIYSDDILNKYPYQWWKCFEPRYFQRTPLFVPDITIFHKGTPIHFVEIVHSSPVTQEKLDRINRWEKDWANVWEIEAEDVLRQTGIPKKLPMKKLQ